MPFPVVEEARWRGWSTLGAPLAMLTLASCDVGALSSSQLLPAARLSALDDPVIELSEQKLEDSTGLAGDAFGASLASLGDMDGDGFDDVVIGAGLDDGLGTDAGAALCYFGTAAGLDPASEVELTASDGQAGDAFGSAVAGVGDVDGDGVVDLVVGAYGDDDTATLAGAAYLYLGTGGGPDSSTESKLTASDGAYGDYFGAAVAGAGDTDGDGFDDVVIGAYGTELGTVYAFMGATSGLDSSSELILEASDGAVGDRYGYALAGAGDINGDGLADIVVGARCDDDLGDESGSAYVVLGSTSGLDSGSEQQILASDGRADAYFGHAVAGLGDLDADGYADIAVSAIGDDDIAPRAGAVYVYLGSATGVDPGTETKLTAPDGAAWEYFGQSVAGAGDLDGDGHDDVVVGAEYDDDLGRDSGSAYLFLGATSGVDIAGEAKILPSDGASGWLLGGAVAGAGDVDGDGEGDVLVGASGADGGAVGTGAAYLFLTDPAPPDEDGDGYDQDEDCDDDDPDVHPGAEERCNGLDDDCDEAVDEDDAVDAASWYLDADGDGYGDASFARVACDPPSGYVADATDCDDGEGAVHPGAEDVCGDGVDSDCDGVGGAGADEDGDGLSLEEEQALGTSDCAADSDGDGLDDPDEVDLHGTDPTLADSDGDGLEDGAEVDEHGTDPNEADSDGDGLDDGEELEEHGTDPLETDTDGDGLDDAEELEEHGTDPTLADTDGDGLDDAEELEEHGTDPTLADTDGDGLDDGDEVEAGTDPLAPPELQPEPGGYYGGKGCSSASAPTWRGWFLVLAALSLVPGYSRRRGREGKP